MTQPMPRQPRSPRYKILAFTSFALAGTGLRYLVSPPVRPASAGIDVVSGLLPLQVVAAVLLVLGVLGLAVVAFRRTGRGVFAAQFGLFLFWAICYWLAFAFTHTAATFSVAVWMTTFAGVVSYATRVEPPLWTTPHWWVALWRRLPWAH